MSRTKDKRRRSSWQTKMERRRRKGLSSSLDDAGKFEIVDISPIHNNGNGSTAGSFNAASAAYLRQKRNSWWNIFVPENFKQRFVNLFLFYLFFVLLTFDIKTCFFLYY